MLRRLSQMVGAIIVVGLVSSAPAAGSTIDPSNDFLASYTGPHNKDLDVTSVDVTFDGTTFVLTGTMADTIGITAAGRYIWGVDRGGGTAGFASIGITGVLFNTVIVLNSNGTGSIAGTPLLPGDVTIDGATIIARVRASLLPSTGLAPSDYTFNLWPRSPGSGNGVISDFAPDNSNVSATFVPEPSTLASGSLASLATLLIARRRRVRS